MKRWRHKAKGTTYTEIGRGKLQISSGLYIWNGSRISLDDVSVVIYQSDDDGSLCIRSVDEFEDGRFELIGEKWMHLPKVPVPQ